MYSNVVTHVACVCVYVGLLGVAAGLFHGIICGQKEAKTMIAYLVGKVFQSQKPQSVYVRSNGRTGGYAAKIKHG